MEIIPINDYSITIWSTINKGIKNHNHIEKGWSNGNFPKPKSKHFVNQKAWENLEWSKDFGLLIDGKVVLMRML